MTEETKNAIKLLQKEGYFIKKITKEMNKDMDECIAADEEGEPKDCCGCSCNTCILQD
ncbi:MAG: hypothetical protein LIR50_03075 [Bacillota bacterium]|nr:hypothetical protein [Bacillota bacterium]